MIVDPPKPRRKWLALLLAVLLGAGLIAAFLLNGCQTRTPEDPTAARGSFTPPTSASVVIDNFRNAVIEKNTENFILCLADEITRSNFPFVFEPSSEVGSRFSALFNTWSVQKERQAFLSFISRLSAEERPILEYLSSNVAFTSPDSIVFVSDYTLSAPIEVTGIPTTLTGTMVLTITPEQSGLWSISRWSDAKRAADTSESTWSVLKAQLSN